MTIGTCRASIALKSAFDASSISRMHLGFFTHFHTQEITRTQECLGTHIEKEPVSVHLQTKKHAQKKTNGHTHTSMFMGFTATTLIYIFQNTQK